MHTGVHQKATGKVSLNLKKQKGFGNCVIVTPTTLSPEVMLEEYFCGSEKTLGVAFVRVKSWE